LNTPSESPATPASVTADVRAIPLAELLKSTPPAADAVPKEPVREIGGRRDGPDPTRYGDWEKNGRCIDF
jgi:hypothetical protein